MTTASNRTEGIESTAMERGLLAQRGTRIAISLLCVLLVVGSIFGPFLVRFEGSAGELAGIALRAGMALIGLMGLATLPGRRLWLWVTAGATAIPGIVALWSMFVMTAIAWTSGHETFASSWISLAGWFSMASPFFAPFITALALLMMQRRVVWARQALVFGIIGGCCVVSVAGNLWM